VARVSGVRGTFFTSDVSIANAADAPAVVTVTFLEHDRDNTASPATTFALAPRETRQMDDLLFTLFGRSETFGALKIQTGPASALVVAERIATPSTTAPGTVGQQVDPVPAGQFFSRGALLGLREDASFRSNVGLFNPNGYAVSVSLALRRARGEPVGSAVVKVPPFGYLQRNLASLFPAASLPSGELLTLGLDAGVSRIFGFAAVIDNVSQDPTFSPGLP
jgi:hypothetical protein